MVDVVLPYSVSLFGRTGEKAAYGIIVVALRRRKWDTPLCRRLEAEVKVGRSVVREQVLASREVPVEHPAASVRMKSQDQDQKKGRGGGRTRSRAFVGPGSSRAHAGFRRPMPISSSRVGRRTFSGPHGAQVVFPDTSA